MENSNLINNGAFPALLSEEYLKSAVDDIHDITVEEATEKGMLLWDDQETKYIPIHYPEKMSVSDLAEMIHISKDIPYNYRIDKNALAEYLWNTCDKNAFITLNELVVVWSEPDDPATLEPSDFVDEQLHRLANDYSDEYAYELTSGYLGKMWFERNIVAINMGEIVRTSREIAWENSDLSDPFFSVDNQIHVGFLTTAIHELRHLQLDTNPLLPEEEYPVSLSAETAVEDYSQDVFESAAGAPNVFPGLFMDGSEPVIDPIPFPDPLTTLPNYDLSSISAISEAAKLADEMEQNMMQTNPGSYEHGYADGFASALRSVTEQIQPTQKLFNMLLDYLAEHTDSSELYRMLHDDLEFTHDEIGFLGFDLEQCYEDIPDEGEKSAPWKYLEGLLGETISMDEYEFLTRLCGMDIMSIEPEETCFTWELMDNLKVIRANTDNLAYITPDVKVEWVNMDEGWNGDYNEKDPNDENLLRFDVSVLRDGRWEEKEDASYCTAFPAAASLEEKVNALVYLGKEYDDALKNDIDVSVKKMGERLSHISLDTIRPNRPHSLSDKLADACQRAGDQATDKANQPEQGR